MGERVTARYRSRKVHLFPWTVGGPENGSLWSQWTYCGRQVDNPDVWSEDGAEVTCGSCLRIEAIKRRD